MSRRLQINGTGRAVLSEFYFRYFTTTSAPAAAVAANKSKSGQKNGLLEEILINSLGFSKEEAVSTLNKVTRSTPIRKDPDLVINFFRDLGLNKSQLKILISGQPELLLCKLEKTLKPKLEFLQELGISGVNLVKFVMAYKTFFQTGLDSHIKPQVEFLKNVLGHDEKLPLVLMKSPSLLSYNASYYLQRNILSLRNIGFSDNDVKRFIIRRPKALLCRKDGWLDEIGEKVKKDFGIYPSDSRFFFGVEILSSYRQTTLDAKYDVFRSFGWCDVEIATLVKNYPLILAASENRLRKSLDFLMNEIGCSRNLLASRPIFFSVNLEKRVILRHEIIKVLNEKKLNRKSNKSFASVVCLSDTMFYRDYILPYKEEVPDIYRLYVEHSKLDMVQKLEEST